MGTNLEPIPDPTTTDSGTDPRGSDASGSSIELRAEPESVPVPAMTPARVTLARTPRMDPGRPRGACCWSCSSPGSSSEAQVSLRSQRWRIAVPSR